MEMLIVVALVMTGSAVAIPVTLQMVRNAKGDSAVTMTSTFIQSARNRAVAERRNIVLTFVSDTKMQYERVEVPSGTTTVLDTLTLEGDNEFTRLANLPDSPDAFGGVKRGQFHRWIPGDVHQRRLVDRWGRRRHQRHDLRRQSDSARTRRASSRLPASLA